MLSDYPVMLTANEVAEVLRTSREVIYEMVRLGRLPGEGKTTPVGKVSP